MRVEFTSFGEVRHNRRGDLIFTARFRDTGHPKTGNRSSVLLANPTAATAGRAGKNPARIDISREYLERRAREWMQSPYASGTLAEARECILQEVLKYRYGLTSGTIARLGGLHESPGGLTADRIEDVQSPDHLLQKIVRRSEGEGGLPPLQDRSEALRETRAAALEIPDPADRAASQPALFPPPEIEPESPEEEQTT